MLSARDSASPAAPSNGSTGSITAIGNAAVTAGTHTFNTSTLNMVGNGTTIRFLGFSPYDLNINSPVGTVSITLSPSAVAGSLAVVDGTFSLNGQNLSVAGSLSVGANDLLAATAAGDNFAETTSTFITAGLGTSLSAPEETFYNLFVSKELRFTLGTLAVGASTINFQGDTWNNLVGAAGFNAGTGLVDFVPPATPVTIQSYGSNTWRNIRCTVPPAPAMASSWTPSGQTRRAPTSIRPLRPRSRTSGSSR